MKKNEKDILKELKAKSDAFKMPVSPDLWDAIEEGIQEEGDKKKGIAWWKIGGVSGVVLVLGAAMILSFGGSENLENSWKDLRSRSKQSVESLNTRFSSVEDVFLIMDASELVIEVEEVQEESKSTMNESNKVNPFHSKTFKDNSSFDNGVEESVLNEPSEQASEKIEVKMTIIESLGANPVETNESLIVDSVSNVERILTDTILTEGISADSTEIDVMENKKRNPFRIMLTGGMGTSFRTLRSDTHGDLVVHKNDHETFGNAFDLGLNVQYDLNSKLFLRSGFNYKFYSDKYDFHHDIIVHTTRNDYQYVQIPLSLGWRALRFGKSDLSLIGITKWNWLYTAQSSWVDPSLLTPVAHNHLGSDTPFRKSTLGIGMALDYRVQLSKKWNFHFIPGIDCFASSVYKRSTDIYQRPYALNADLGISYNF